MPDSTIRTRRWEIADYAQAYESGLVSPVEVAESIIERLQELDESNRIFISQDPEHLLQQARMSSSRSSSPSAIAHAFSASSYVKNRVDFGCISMLTRWIRCRGELVRIILASIESVYHSCICR